MRKIFRAKSKLIKGWDRLDYFKEKHRTELSVEVLHHCELFVPCGVMLHESITEEQGEDSKFTYTVLDTVVYIMTMDELVKLKEQQDERK